MCEHQGKNSNFFALFAYPLLVCIVTEPHGLLRTLSCFLFGLGSVCNNSNNNDNDDAEILV